MTHVRPLSDLVGTLHMSYAGKKDADAIVAERKVCERELERAFRCIESIGELSLPDMHPSSRSASAVKEARQGVLPNGAASSRSNSIFSSSNRHAMAVAAAASSRSESPGAADPEYSASADPKNSSRRSASVTSQNQQYREDPQMRREALAVHTHELVAAAKAVTSIPGDSLPRFKELPGKKAGATVTSWVSTHVAVDQSYDEMRKSQLESARQADQAGKHPANRIGFRPLHPIWTRDQHKKHRQVSAKAFQVQSEYQADEQGVVPTPRSCKTKLARRALLQEEHRKHMLEVLRFKYVCTQQKSTDENRKERDANQTEKPAQQQQQKKRKPIKFQVPRCGLVSFQPKEGDDDGQAAGETASARNAVPESSAGGAADEQ